MSEQPQSRADQVEEAAALWLARSEGDAWSGDDQAALDAWLAQSMAHKAAYWRLRHAWSRADRAAALRAPEEPVAAAPLRSSGPSRWRPMAIAASVAVALGLGGAFLLNHPPATPKAFATEVGGREIVPLADGSKVELNTATRLRAQVGRARRTVWLDEGEAYFDVAKDPAHPFTILAGPRRITVLGTKFSVKRRGDNVTVAVIEGRVRVEEIEPGSGRVAAARVVTRGDLVVAQGPATLVAAPSVERVSDALSWREGVLTFDQQTLAEVAAEFNRYNRKQVSVDASAAAIRIGGRFQAEDVEAFTQLLKQAYGLRVVDDGSTVKISV